MKKKFKQTVVSIKTPSNKAHVLKAWVLIHSEDLAIHKTIGETRGYTITHLPTMGAFAQRIKSLKEAKGFLEKLRKITGEFKKKHCWGYL